MNIDYLVQNGGAVLMPLLALSLATLALAIERAVYFRWTTCQRAAPPSQPGADGLPSSVPECALHSAAAGIRTGALPPAAWPRAVDDALAEGRRGLRALDFVVCVAPMLGILGTVLGMVNGFGQPASAADSPVAMLLDGIAEALATTILGLVIAAAALLVRHACAAGAERHEGRVVRCALTADPLDGGRAA